MTDNCIDIIQNPFGNYIIQFILDIWGAETCNSILLVIEHNIVSFSMQKYSSNVVEKCLDLVTAVNRKRWNDEIFNHSRIISLVKNKYGNYVLQKALQMMSFSEKSERRGYLIEYLNVFHKKDKARLKEFIDVI
jgi:hypothetical protein